MPCSNYAWSYVLIFALIYALIYALIFSVSSFLILFLLLIELKRKNTSLDPIIYPQKHFFEGKSIVLREGKRRNEVNLGLEKIKQVFIYFAIKPSLEGLKWEKRILRKVRENWNDSYLAQNTNSRFSYKAAKVYSCICFNDVIVSELSKNSRIKIIFE